MVREMGGAILYKRFAFRCPFCGHIFGTLPGLRNHALRAHLSRKGRPPFKCPACGQEFNGPDELAKHIKTSALWCWNHGRRHPEARLHMALAYLACRAGYKATWRRGLFHVWREAAREEFEVEVGEP